MRKQGLLIALIFFCCTSYLSAQEMFKGKITYKLSYSGDKKLTDQIKMFMPKTESITTDGKMFRLTFDGTLKREDIIFENNQAAYYLVDHKNKTIKQKEFRKREAQVFAPELKEPGKVKVIAGLQAHKVDVYREGKKMMEVWVNKQYYLKVTGEYQTQNTMLDGSIQDFDKKLLLGFTLFHPTGKAQMSLTASEISLNVPKGAFKLPKAYKKLESAKQDDDK